MISRSARPAETTCVNAYLRAHSPVVLGIPLDSEVENSFFVLVLQEAERHERPPRDYPRGLLRHIVDEDRDTSARLRSLRCMSDLISTECNGHIPQRQRLPPPAASPHALYA